MYGAPRPRGRGQSIWGRGADWRAATAPMAPPAQCCGVEVMMHLTCSDISREDARAALRAAKESGLHNILALRGDPPRGEAFSRRMRRHRAWRRCRLRCCQSHSPRGRPPWSGTRALTAPVTR